MFFLSDVYDSVYYDDDDDVYYRGVLLPYFYLNSNCLNTMIDNSNF